MTLEEFLEQLRRAVREGAYTRQLSGDASDPKIRLARRAGTGATYWYCPITAVAQYVGVGDFPIMIYFQAAVSLGLPPVVAMRVVNASDRTDGNEGARQLRGALLEAMRSEAEA
jgi:hypothetical protein